MSNFDNIGQRARGLPPVSWPPGQLHGLKIELLFWLQHSHIQHRVSLDASPHERAVYSLEYNSKR